VVANGEIYIASSGSITASDSVSGQIIWSDSSSGPHYTRVGNMHWGSPIVTNGRVYVVDLSSDYGGLGPSRLTVFTLDGVFKNGFDPP
jgi:outer membrane protein assembly factor BamB